MVKLTKRAVETLLRNEATGTTWDSTQRGFGVRVRNGRATFVLKTRLGPRQLWITLGGYQGTGGKLTVEQARDQAVQKLAEVGRGIDPTAAKRAAAVERQKNPTFAEAAQRYLLDASGYLAPSTLEERGSVLREGGPLLRSFGSKRLNEIGRRELLEWWTTEVESASCAQKTGRNWLDALVAVFAHAVDLEDLEASPVHGFRAVLRRRNRTKAGRALAQPSREVRPIESPEEIERLVAASASRPWTPRRRSVRGLSDGHLFTLLLLDAGLRMGEVAGLRWGSVRWGRDASDTSRALTIRETMARGRHQGTPKSGRERTVAMSRRLRTALLERYMAQGRPADDQRVIPSAGLSPTNYRRRHFAQSCTAAKIGARKPKDLRDTFASQLLTCGISLGYVSQQLGHADVAVTAKHYAKWCGGQYRAPLALELGEVPADLLGRLPKSAGLGAVEVAS